MSIEAIQKVKELAAEVARLLDENKRLKEQLEEYQLHAVLKNQKQTNERLSLQLDKLRERVSALERGE